MPPHKTSQGHIASVDEVTPHAHPPRRPRAPPSEHAFERAASLFRAAGDVARLKLLVRLSEGEWCVTELAESTETKLSTVSQQLKLLRAERIVTRRRDGKHLYYSLADAHVLELIRNALEHADEHAHPQVGEPPA
jgi:hypothetical protein